MRRVTDGRLALTHDVRRHLELCLDCRACETACPSGVQYGKLIEPFRVAMEQPGERRAQVGRLVSPLDSVSAVSLSAAACDGCSRRRGSRSGWGSIGAGRATGPAAAVAAAAAATGRHAAAARTAAAARCPSSCRPIGRRRARVALFTGCVADAMFRHTHWATARVLQQNGCDVLVPRGAGLLRRDPLPRRRERAGPRVGRHQPRGLRHERASTR